jgi:DNA-binding response OmpR family regulator
MKRILIIEDDQIVANIYRNKFLVEGYQVDVASDGEAGIASIRSFRPDAVILDLMLPRLTGVELMKRVRSERDFEKLPIIVFSNTYLSNLVQEAWKAGATKCLSKANCTPKQLVEIIRGTLAPTGASATGSGTGGSVTERAPAPAESPESPPNPKPLRSAADNEASAKLRRTFNESLPATLKALRAQLQSMVKSSQDGERLKQIHQMYRHVHAVTGSAGLTGLVHLARMTDALEALLKELHEKPKNINVSTLRTVASAIDFLGWLVERRRFDDTEELPPASVLVVDDEAISRRAVTHALEKAKLKCVSVEKPEAAYDLLAQNRYDLVFLDVDMPGMNGFELCSKLRTMSRHKKTPVVFVTGLNDLESRANSMVSGGNDFIAKPFLFMEMAVKALVFVMRGQLERAAHLTGA